MIFEKVQFASINLTLLIPFFYRKQRADSKLGWYKALKRFLHFVLSSQWTK